MIDILAFLDWPPGLSAAAGMRGIDASNDTGTLADEDGLTEARMANAAGYKSLASASRSFASAGLLIANYLSLEAASSETSTGSDRVSFLGFQDEPRKNQERGNWVHYPEFRDAVRAVL